MQTIHANLKYPNDALPPMDSVFLQYVQEHPDDFFAVIVQKA
jgi:hypothetical protein